MIVFTYAEECNQTKDDLLPSMNLKSNKLIPTRLHLPKCDRLVARGMPDIGKTAEPIHTILHSVDIKPIHLFSGHTIVTCHQQIDQSLFAQHLPLDRRRLELPQQSHQLLAQHLLDFCPSAGPSQFSLCAQHKLSHTRYR